MCAVFFVMSMSQENWYISWHCLKIGDNILAGPFPFITKKIPFFLGRWLSDLINREYMGQFMLLLLLMREGCCKLLMCQVGICNASHQYSKQTQSYNLALLLFCSLPFVLAFLLQKWIIEASVFTACDTEVAERTSWREAQINKISFCCIVHFSFRKAWTLSRFDPLILTSFAPSNQVILSLGYFRYLNASYILCLKYLVIKSFAASNQVILGYLLHIF